MLNVRKHHLILIIVGIVIVVGLAISPLMSASCSVRRGAQGDAQALAQLRSMTHGGVLPAESVVAKIESDYPETRVAGLARILRARIKQNAGDAAGAAALLDSSVISKYTSLGDYALLLRARALEQAARRTEARAAYEKLFRDYPTSMRAREAALRNAEMVSQDGQAAAAPVLLKDLSDKNDASALLLTAKAYEQTGDPTRALASYRRIYFYAPASIESTEAAAAITRLNSTLAPATSEEALTRADKLYEAKRYKEAADAYADAFSRFSQTASAQTQLRRGIALANLKRTGEAAAALNLIPSSAGETRAEAFYYLVQTYAQGKQWDMARKTLEEMRGAFANSPFTVRAFVKAGELARDAKNNADETYFFRTAINSYPNAVEVAQAQFELAWLAHDSKNFQESSRLLTEHLAIYADRNTDNRGRAGYWAARDSERAGKLAEARALYQAMQARYEANWYGYLAQQRLDTMTRNRTAPQQDFAANSMVGRAIANLKTVSVEDETAGSNEQERIVKADQLTNIGLEDWAIDELELASQTAPDSPRINLALAQIYRSRDDNVRALNTLKKSFPDYSQMKPEELTREQWDVFYPLAYWDIIVQESRARSLDPHQVAGLIRQESVFNPRAASGARAYGLMQLLVPTGKLTAQKYGVERDVTADSLYEPRLNIQLGTAYLKDQMDKYGRIEYVAAAYNAGPGRVVQWRATLPLEMDEWAEAIPFKETRGYVQGVVRNTLQYKRLYDDNGKFRPEVGTRAVRPLTDAGQTNAPAVQSNGDQSVRPRKVGGNEEE
ncbi:MAG TPA: transglycosylase SLT domain-containing protein [Pyrinomonadaceae bacterium]